jgi:hypothetical protein
LVRILSVLRCAGSSAVALYNLRSFRGIEAVLKNPLSGPSPQLLRELTYSSPYPTPFHKYRLQKRKVPWQDLPKNRQKKGYP